MTLPYGAPQVVLSDPYGPSPLVTDLSIRNRALFDLASERGPAPTLFATGDLPPFTTSGVDPSILEGLPYHWRHAAAYESDRSVVLDWLEQVAQDRDAFGRAGGRQHPGLLEYQVRMERWVAGLSTPDLPFEDASYPTQWQTPRMTAAIAVRPEER